MNQAHPRNRAVAAAIFGCRIARLPAGWFGANEVMTQVRFCVPGGKMPPDTAGKMPAATNWGSARMRPLESHVAHQKNKKTAGRISRRLPSC